MPPKCKFTREEVIQAALEIARAEGIQSVTARALGTKLGSSSKPIFSIFESMEEVQQEVEAAAKHLYGQYVKKGLNQREMPAFKGVGMGYIRFALEEPKLFQMLFMSEQASPPSITNILPVIEEHYPQILLSIEKSYNMTEGQAEILYHHLWIYTHGIAVLCATNMCVFTAEELERMLTEVFVSILKEMKRGEKND